MFQNSNENLKIPLLSQKVSLKREKKLLKHKKKNNQKEINAYTER